MLYRYLSSLQLYAFLILLPKSWADPISALAPAASISTAQASGEADVAYDVDTSNTTADNSDYIDLAGFTFDASQMPEVPGLNESQPAVFQPLQRATDPLNDGPTQTSFPSGSSTHDSTLSRRSVSTNVFFYATTGSLNTWDHHTVYPTNVSATQQHDFYQAAEAYSVVNYRAGRLQGNESSHAYFRFTSGNLTMVAVSYGEAASGDEPFDWDDFSIVAQWLGNLTLKYPDNNVTWNGYIEMSDHTRSIDFFITPSFGDIPATNQTSPSVIAKTAIATALATSASQPSINGGGGRRLTTRAPSVNLGINNIRMTVRKATATIISGLLYDLASTALSILEADSGQNPQYQSFASTSCDQVVAEMFGRSIFHFVTVGNNVITRETLLTVLDVLVEIGKAKRFNAGFTRVLFGELVVRGRVLARWSLGKPISGYNPCYFVNPDGTYALGCLQRVYNPDLK
ncbi:hypothetical protein MMC21_008488 [Puttea exsequens]|nr:hypothetical protein [Puttea exsequens]